MPLDSSKSPGNSQIPCLICPSGPVTARGIEWMPVSTGTFSRPCLSQSIELEWMPSAHWTCSKCHGELSRVPADSPTLPGMPALCLCCSRAPSSWHAGPPCLLHSSPPPSFLELVWTGRLDYSWPLHSLFTLALRNWLFVCPVGSMAAGPADLDFRVGAVLIAVQLPVKANRSSSIFFLRCLISKSLSFSNLYNRPFSSTVSWSWSRSCSISSSSTLQGKGIITGGSGLHGPGLLSLAGYWVVTRTVLYKTGRRN